MWHVPKQQFLKTKASSVHWQMCGVYGRLLFFSFFSSSFSSSESTSFDQLCFVSLFLCNFNSFLLSYCFFSQIQYFFCYNELLTLYLPTIPENKKKRKTEWENNINIMTYLTDFIWIFISCVCWFILLTNIFSFL